VGKGKGTDGLGFVWATREKGKEGKAREWMDGWMEHGKADLIPRVPLLMAALEGLAVGWVLAFFFLLFPSPTLRAAAVARRVVARQVCVGPGARVLVDAAVAGGGKGVESRGASGDGDGTKERTRTTPQPTIYDGP
jgi:glycogen debranching enzyme